MKHLPIAKFQGAILGGQILPVSLQSTAYNQVAVDSEVAMNGGIESILRHGCVNLTDWLQSTTPVRREFVAVYVTLPIMLCHHDDRSQWQKAAVEIGRYWQLRGEVTATIYTLGYAIACCFAEGVEPQNFIDRLLADIPTLPSPLLEQLTYIKTSLAKQTSLHDVVETLMKSPDPIVTSFAIALYCWLTAIEDYDLTLRRALMANYQPNFTCALAGTLSGAYLSLTGIPSVRQISLPATNKSIALAQQLYGAWAGIYNPTNIDVRQVFAIGAKNSIQTR
jgi:hypothetical protein